MSRPRQTIAHTKSIVLRNMRPRILKSTQMWMERCDGSARRADDGPPTERSGSGEAREIGEAADFFHGRFPRTVIPGRKLCQVKIWRTSRSTPRRLESSALPTRRPTAIFSAGPWRPWILITEWCHHAGYPRTGHQPGPLQNLWLLLSGHFPAAGHDAALSALSAADRLRAPSTCHGGKS